MTYIGVVKNLKKGSRISVNNQLLKVKRVDVFEDDLGGEWRLFYLEEGYKLEIEKDNISFFKVTELEEGDEFLESVKIENMEEVEEITEK